MGRDGAHPPRQNKRHVKIPLSVLLLVPFAAVAAENSTPPPVDGFDAAAAERFAKLALACVHKEYPNKISHVLNSDADVAPPPCPACEEARPD